VQALGVYAKLGCSLASFVFCLVQELIYSIGKVALVGKPEPLRGEAEIEIFPVGIVREFGQLLALRSALLAVRYGGTRPL
jgi:hypothetical protein